MQKHGLVSIAYRSGVSVQTDHLQDAQAAAAFRRFRLSAEERWGVAGETLDGFMAVFPAIGLHFADFDAQDIATQFAALDELQNENARLHDAHVAERKKRKEAIQALEETQRTQEFKEKQHREREQTLLEQMQGAESSFARLKDSLEREKISALGKLKAEIGRLQAALQEQEAAFRRKELELAREKQDLHQ